LLNIQEKNIQRANNSAELIRLIHCPVLYTRKKPHILLCNVEACFHIIQSAMTYLVYIFVFNFCINFWTLLYSIFFQQI